jgi:sirohydrochlorin cobaltochelatase
LADYILQQEGHPQYHVGTISGYPTLQNIKGILRKSGCRKVVLAPLIMVAAGHATKDIFLTWREALEAEGYEVRLVKKGVLEFPEIRQLMIERIKREIAEP